MLWVGYYLGNQRYPQGLECPQHWLLTWYPPDLYPWGALCHTQMQLLLVLVMMVSSLPSLGLHMGINNDTGDLAEMCHGYTHVCLGFDLPNKCHHPMELWENFFSVASSLKKWSVLDGDVWWWFLWCCTGKGGSAPLQTGQLVWLPWLVIGWLVLQLHAWIVCLHNTCWDSMSGFPDLSMGDCMLGKLVCTMHAGIAYLASLACD